MLARRDMTLFEAPATVNGDLAYERHICDDFRLYSGQGSIVQVRKIVIFEPMMVDSARSEGDCTSSAARLIGCGISLRNVRCGNIVLV
jgi:hypothetical protein